MHTLQLGADCKRRLASEMVKRGPSSNPPLVTASYFYFSLFLALYSLFRLDESVPVKAIQRQPVDEDMKENVMLIRQDGEDGPSSLPPTVSSLPVTLIKALAEPTRVKSPEMSVVRSPDPVNWTVPLDTGKCFTVTQNIRGGDGSRPHSELKVSVNIRPAAPLAAVAPAPANVVKNAPAMIPAPGSPPHDSLGYFSEPEMIVVECPSSSASDTSET